MMTAMHRRAVAAFVFCLLGAVAGAQVPGFGTYTYDPSGNVTSVGTQTFRYDAFGRVAKATLSRQQEQTYTYDRYGNLQRIDTKLNGTTLQAQQPAVNPCTNRIEVPLPGGTGCTTPAGYNVVGTYDAAGNVLSLEGNSFEYDVLNTTTASTVGGVRRVHMYTASGERVATATMAGGSVQRWDYTLRDASNRVLRRLSQQGGIWRWEEDYIYAGGKLIAAAVRSPEKVLHFHSDHLGTPRLVTGNGGARVTANNYFPFGRELPPAGTSASATPPFDDAVKFTGHERDAATLDYMHARYYAPYVGRFLSVDPKNRRVPLKQPQMYNRYAYAMNNPLNFVDLDGEDVTPIRVLMTGGKPKIVYIDSRMVPRLQNLVTTAHKQGVSFTFSSMLRTQEQQDGIKTGNTKNNKGTSPHTAGLAIDINVSSSLKGTDLAGLTTIARGADLSPLNNQKADPPHFQANDLITRGDDGKVDDQFKDLVKENQKQVEDYEKMRKEDPENFDKEVVRITPPA